MLSYQAKRVFKQFSSFGDLCPKTLDYHTLADNLYMVVLMQMPVLNITFGVKNKQKSF